MRKLYIPVLNVVMVFLFSGRIIAFIQTGKPASLHFNNLIAILRKFLSYRTIAKIPSVYTSPDNYPASFGKTLKVPVRFPAGLMLVPYPGFDSHSIQNKGPLFPATSFFTGSPTNLINAFPALNINAYTRV